MRSSGWALVGENWCLYGKGKSGPTQTHTHTHTHTEGIQKTHRKKLAMGLECCTYA